MAKIKQAFVTGNGDIFQLCTCALGKKLPRYNVTMVLHLSQQDDVAFAQISRAPRGSNEVQSLSGAACEDDVLSAPDSPDKRGSARPVAAFFLRYR